MKEGQPLERFLTYYFDRGTVSVRYDMAHDRYDATWEVPLTSGDIETIHGSVSRYTLLADIEKAAYHFAEAMYREFESRVSPADLVVVDVDFREFEFL